MILEKILSRFLGETTYKQEQKPKEDESDDFQKIFDAELKKRLEVQDNDTMRQDH